MFTVLEESNSPSEFDLAEDEDMPEEDSQMVTESEVAAGSFASPASANQARGVVGHWILQMMAGRPLSEATGHCQQLGHTLIRGREG